MKDLKYAKGGGVKDKTQLEDVVIYHESKGNFLYSKGTIYAWLYDVPNAEQKIQSGEFDFVFFPLGRSSFGASRQTPALLKVWNKSFQKNRKGSEHLIGISQGFFNEEEGILYIEMMTTRKDYRRKGVNSKIVKAMRDYFKLPQDKVVFLDTTKEGKKFEDAKTYNQGGGINAKRGYVDKDNKLKDRMVYISISREIFEGRERNSVVDFDYWKKLELAYPEETSGIGYKWEKQKEKELGGYSQFVQKYYQWQEENGYPYEIAKKVYDKLNNFDITRNGIAIIDLKTRQPILRQRWNEYVVGRGFIDKEDILSPKFAQGGGIEFVPEKKGTLIKGNEIIKYFEKVNGNYRLVFYTLNEAKGKVPKMCDAFSYCQELDSNDVTTEQLVELIKKNNLMENGGEIVFVLNDYETRKFARNEPVWFQHSDRNGTEALLLEKTKSGKAKIKILMDYKPYARLVSSNEYVSKESWRRSGEKETVKEGVIKIVPAERIGKVKDYMPINHIPHSKEFIDYLGTYAKGGNTNTYNYSIGGL